MPWRPFFKISLILLTLYFALVWAGALLHPAWLPDEVEPMIVLVGVLFSLVAWWEEIVEKIRGQRTQTEPKYLVHPPTNLAPGALGRVQERKKLRRQLAHARRPVVVCAIGGMGKTTLAQMFWRDFKGDYDHVAWLSAVALFSADEERRTENAEYFLRAFTDNVELRSTLALVFDPQERPVEHFRRVLAALAKVPGRNLLVVDNAPEAAALYAEDLSRLADNWRILITARQAMPNMDAFELDALSRDEAARLFWNIHSDGVTRSHPVTTPGLDEILHAIGYHTLTIELLAAYAREKKLDVAALRAELQARGLGQLDGYNLTVRRSGKNQPLHAHLRDTFLLDLGEQEKELLRYCCILPPYGADVEPELRSEEFLCALFGKEADKPGFHNLLRDLTRMRWLVERDGAYACHPVIAETAKAQLLPDAENCAVVIENVTDLLTPDAGKNEPVIARARYAPLGEAVLDAVWKTNGDFTEADGAVAELALPLGSLFGGLGELGKALACSQKALAIREKVLPAEHLDLAQSYNNLAVAFDSLGEHQKCMEFLQKALAIREKVLPAQHPDVAQSYNNLATTYGALGDHRKCLAFLQKALAIWEKVLPADHPELATSYNNLAEAYGAFGDHQKRLEFNQKALVIREKALLADHPSLALSYNNLAETYGALGNHQKRLEFNQKALAIREKVLSADHPDLAQSYNNLAETYGALGDHQKQLKFNQKAFAIWEKVLPAEHSDLARSYNNLATTYGNLGDHQKRLEFNQKALTLWEKVLPIEHPNLAISFNNLACTYHDLGDLDNACAYMRRAAAIWEKSLPPDHRYVLESKRDLATLEEKRQAGRE